MQSNIIFLDDQPALSDVDVSKYFASNIQNITKLLLELKKIRPNFQIHLNTSFNELQISQSYKLKEICKIVKHPVKDDLVSLKTKLQKSPYSIDKTEKVEDSWGIDILCNGIKYESLIWAYLLDTSVISFCNNIQNWQLPHIKAELKKLTMDEDIHEECINIRHINCLEHIKIHTDWLGRYDQVPPIENFLQKTDNFLTYIKILDEAKENLRKLLPHYEIIYGVLARVNVDLANWDKKSELAFSVKYAKGEHFKRAAALKKQGLEGYEAHLYFTGIAGRIHYRIINGIMEIKYIGKKL